MTFSFKIEMYVKYKLLHILIYNIHICLSRIWWYWVDLIALFSNCNDEKLYLVWWKFLKLDIIISNNYKEGSHHWYTEWFCWFLFVRGKISYTQMWESCNCCYQCLWPEDNNCRCTWVHICYLNGRELRKMHTMLNSYW